MRRFDTSGIVRTSALAAVLAATPLALSAQATTAAPATHAPAAQPGTTTQHVPTPEELGDSLMTHRRYQAAIEAYKNAPQKSAVLWNKMGIAFQMMFNTDDAARCYRESLKLNRKNPNVWNNLGTIYDSQRDYGEAVKMYHKALKINPNLPLVLKNLGTDLFAQHKYKKGWEAYQAAIAIDPNIFGNDTGPRVQNPSSLQQRGAMNYYMARSCARAGLNDRAIEYLRMALNEGFTSAKKIEEDSEFAGLRKLPAFQQLISEQTNP